MRMRHLLRSTDVLVTLCGQAAREADAILHRRASVPITLPALEDREGVQELAPASGHTILAAGRLVPEKGFDILIEAFASTAHLNTVPVWRLA